MNETIGAGVWEVREVRAAIRPSSIMAPLADWLVLYAQAGVGKDWKAFARRERARERRLLNGGS